MASILPVRNTRDSLILATRSYIPTMGDCFGSCIQPPYKSDVVRSGDNGLTWVRLNMGGIHVVSDSGLFVSADGIEWKDMGATGGDPVFRIAVGDAFITISSTRGRLLRQALDPATLALRRSAVAGVRRAVLTPEPGFQALDRLGIKRRLDGKRILPGSVPR